MRQTLHKIVNVLDGQPTGVRGQSLVEMTVTFPLLILMVLSLVEVGFIANNYLILMDVVRAAGRAAVTTRPDATQWDDSTAGLPQSRNVHRMDCNQNEANGNDHHDDYHRVGNATVAGNPDPNVYDARSLSQPSAFGGTNPGMFGPRGKHLITSLGYWGAGQPDVPFGFFDAVTCEATRSFAPLIFNDDDNTKSKDDIVVSAISYETLVYSNPANAGDAAKFASGPGLHQFGGNYYWVTVTGRYPQANRYCVNSTGIGPQGDDRDPFDFLRHDFYNQWHNGGAVRDEFSPGGFWGEGLWDPNLGNTFPAADNISGNYIPGSVLGASQGVRGFVFTGNNVNPDNCYGSRFTVQDIEDRLNLNNASLNTTIPNGGAVIVEIFWQHHPLFLGPLFEGYNGNKFNDPVLWVWGWFPLPSVEPTQTPRAPGS